MTILILKTYVIEKEHKTILNTPYRSFIKISPFSIKLRTNSDKNSNNSLHPLFKIPPENKRFYPSEEITFWSSADRNSRTPWTGLTRAWLTIIEIWRASWPRTRVTDASPLSRCCVISPASWRKEGRKRTRGEVRNEIRSRCLARWIQKAVGVCTVVETRRVATCLLLSLLINAKVRGPRTRVINDSVASSSYDLCSNRKTNRDEFNEIRMRLGLNVSYKYFVIFVKVSKRLKGKLLYSN